MMPPFLSVIYAKKNDISIIYLALLYNLIQGLLPRYAKLSNRLMIFCHYFKADSKKLFTR